MEVPRRNSGVTPACLALSMLLAAVALVGWPASAVAQGASGARPFLAALSTASARRTAEWYQTHLGFRLVRFDTLAHGVSVAILERDGFYLEIATLPGSRPRLDALVIPTNNGSLQGLFKLGFWVSDADSAARAFASRGVALYRGLGVDSTLGGGVRYFLVRDPDSTVVQIFGPLRR